MLTAAYMRHGDLIRKAPWKPIITDKQWQRLNEIFGRRVVHNEADIYRLDYPKKGKREPLNRVGVLTGLIETKSQSFPRRRFFTK